MFQYDGKPRKKPPLSSFALTFANPITLAISAGASYEITPELRVNRFFIENDSHPASMISLAIRLAVPL